MDINEVFDFFDSLNEFDRSWFTEFAIKFIDKNGQIDEFMVLYKADQEDSGDDDD